MNEAENEVAGTLDDVFAEIIRLAEQGEPIDCQQYAARYPRWADEIAEFLEGRAEIERFAARLARPTTAEGLRLPGTRLRTIGDYELLDVIGQGGMGCVYRARQVSLGRLVAVKILSEQRCDRARFEAEARAAASLDHPQIVSIYETGEHAGYLYYAMQLIEGEDLRQRIERQSLLPGEAADHARKLARAVQYAHDRGVLHRDLKPANVLLDANEEPYVADFGLAKELDRETQLTQTGDVLGTPSYMAPEQAAGDLRNVTTATDVYGLGAILYAMLTGRPPFDGPSGIAVLRQVQQEKVQPPRAFAPSTPRDLETICLKCLEKEPASRYQSAAELADDLDRHLKGEPILARPVPVWERVWRWSRRHPGSASLTAAVLVLLLVTAVGGAAFAMRERAARQREALLNEQRRQALAQAEVNLINMYTDHGRAAHFERFASEGALWYAQAAVLAQRHPEYAAAAWLRASVADRHTPDPVHAVLFADQWIRSLSFHPQNTHLLVQTDRGDVYVCDLDTPASSLGDAAPTEQTSSPLLSLAPPRPIPDVGQVSAAHWTPDGKRLLVGDRAGRLIVLDFPTFRVTQVIDVGEPITAAAVAPDGSLAAVAAGNTVHGWRLDSALVSLGSVVHSDEVVHLAFSPQADRVLTQSRDRRVRVYAVTSERFGEQPLLPALPQTISKPDREQIVSRAAFVRGGKEVLTQPNAQEVRCYDAGTGKLRRKVKLAGRRPPIVDRTGRVMAASGKYSTKLWQIDSGKAIRSMEHRDYITVLGFSPDGQIVAMGGLDCRLRLGQVFSRSFRTNIQHHAPIEAIAFAPRGDLVASAQRGGLVRVWRIDRHTDPPAYEVPVGKRGSRIGIVLGSKAWIDRGSFSPHANLRAVDVRRVEDGERIGPRLPVDGILRDAAFSADGSLIAAVSTPSQAATPNEGELVEAGRLFLWNWPEGRRRCDPLVLPAMPRSVACDATGQRVAVQLVTNEVALVDASNGKLLHRLQTSVTGNPTPRDVAGEVRFAHDGATLIAWGGGNRVCVWDAALGQPRYAPLKHDAEITNVQCSSDQTLLATASADGVARVWDLTTGALAADPMVHPDTVYSVRFDAPGRRLVTSCADDRARIIDWRSGTIALEVNLHDNDVFDAMLTSDDRWLISAGDNNIVVVSDARDGRFVDRVIMASGLSTKTTSDRQATLAFCDNGQRIIVGGNRSAITVADLTHLSQSPRLTPAQLYHRAVLTASMAIGRDGLILLNAQQWCTHWTDHAHR